MDFPDHRPKREREPDADSDFSADSGWDFRGKMEVTSAVGVNVF